MKNKKLMISIKQVVLAYHSPGFKVQAILSDRQFKHIQQLIVQKGITLKYVPPMNTDKKMIVTEEQQMQE